MYGRRYVDWARRFNTYFTTKAKVPATSIVLLSGDKEFTNKKDAAVKGEATSENVLKTLADLAKTLNPQDQFVLVLLGHGSVSDALPTMELPGPDLSNEALAKALEAIPAENQVILNFASKSGEFLKPLARKGRVNVTACSEGDAGEPVYAEFFLQGLESGKAGGEAVAGGTKDGSVTVMQAYNWAAAQTAMWILRQTLVKEDKTWQVQGKQSVELFKKLYDGPEDDPASRKLSDLSDATKDDAPVSLAPAKDRSEVHSRGDRRLLNERSTLEDCGQESGVTALRGDSGYEPITGDKAGEAGALARRIVLGNPQLKP